MMTDALTPRQTIKSIVRGAAPPHPLLMPIIFSLGARMENLPLRGFQANPTKIANALRQIRGVLRVDGLTCYSDEFLEAEALGCRREWRDDGSSSITCPSFSGIDDLRGKMNSPDSLSSKGHIPVACEVLRRLKVMLKDEPALMVRVNGPFSLAAQFLGHAFVPQGTQPRDLVEFAAEVTTSVSKALLEAGADVILLTEILPPGMSAETCDWYASLLSPVANVVRFYEALPVLFLAGVVSEANLSRFLERHRDCIPCWTPPAAELGKGRLSCLREGFAGIALPAEAFRVAQACSPEVLANCASDRRIVFVTSPEDLAETTQPKDLARVLSAIREGLRPPAQVG
ncbi:MAG: uroporphyrinogen decarboxylase family protein [Terriglobales bacterium]